MTARPDAVIVLAGGSGRRLGGVDKAALMLGGRSLLDRVLAAVAGRPTVVVGPVTGVPAGVTVTQEDPPGGGPAAGVAAGLAAVLSLLAGEPAEVVGPNMPALVAVLAVDQPGVTAATLSRLVGAVPDDRATGAVLVAGGRRQYAAGVFPAGALAAAVAGRRSWQQVPLRVLIDPLVGAEVPAEPDEAADVDTPQDLERWRARLDGR